MSRKRMTLDETVAFVDTEGYVRQKGILGTVIASLRAQGWGRADINLFFRKAVDHAYDDA